MFHYIFSRVFHHSLIYIHIFELRSSLLILCTIHFFRFFGLLTCVVECCFHLCLHFIDNFTKYLTLLDCCYFFGTLSCIQFDFSLVNVIVMQVDFIYVPFYMIHILHLFGIHVMLNSLFSLFLFLFITSKYILLYSSDVVFHFLMLFIRGEFLFT